MKPSPERLAAYHKGVVESIKKHGRQVIGVFGTEDDPGPPFSYSIGNSLHGKPELLILGLAPTDAAGVINYVSEKLDPASFKDGEIVSLGGEFGLKVVVAGDEARKEYTIQVGTFTGSETYPVLQLLVPDKHGIYPGEPGCEEPYASVPVLRAK